MRNLLFLSVICSFSALACPDISGDYLCQRGNDSIERLIEEMPAGFRINSQGNLVEYITDGSTIQTLPDNDSMENASFISRCTNKQMIVDFKATLMYEGAVVGKQTSKTTYEIKNGKLAIVQETKVKKGPFPSIKLPTITEICTLR